MPSSEMLATCLGCQIDILQQSDTKWTLRRLRAIVSRLEPVQKPAGGREAKRLAKKTKFEVR
ncbi:uncharacterized protein MEPE_02626 [Melanopsichium pennsylvanicum]|uniref:Uncharacterized protein n=1 Tax=Melanopsichium pennsylvanicum TaxID=63383 RepID=A0AAJ4XMV7_9BASI|nr:uncharacterized protein MEPE_02626 [Melanopsichium pennsylvanicum]